MKKMIMILALIITSGTLLAMIKPLSNIKKEHQNIFSQVRLDIGSITILDQFMVREHKSTDNNYLVTMHCKRKNGKVGKSQCKAIKYELL